MRRRAGHASTTFYRDGRAIALIATSDGGWVTTGVAKDWQRCERCRKPEDMMPEGGNLCVHCFYYQTGAGHWFWSRKSDYLFPYNIGKRVIEATVKWDRHPLGDWRVDWRAYLATSHLPELAAPHDVHKFVAAGTAS